MMDLARELLDRQRLAEGSNLASSEDVAIDAALRAIGPLAGEFLGTDAGVRIAGTDTEADRFAQVHPASQGSGLLTQVAGYGAVNIASALFKTARVARNEDDYFELFSNRRQVVSEGTWKNSDSGSSAYVHPNLQLAIPCAADVSTLLVAMAMIQVRPGTVSATISGQCVIGGNEVEGDFSTLNTRGANGPITTQTGSANRETMLLYHARTLTPRFTDPEVPRGASMTISVSARIWVAPTGTTGNKIGSAHLLVARIPL